MIDEEAGGEIGFTENDISRVVKMEGRSYG